MIQVLGTDERGSFEGGRIIDKAYLTKPPPKILLFWAVFEYLKFLDYIFHSIIYQSFLGCKGKVPFAQVLHWNPSLNSLIFLTLQFLQTSLFFP